MIGAGEIGRISSDVVPRSVEIARNAGRRKRIGGVVGEEGRGRNVDVFG